MPQVRFRRAKARVTICSATLAWAAGRRAPRDAAAADAEALRPAVETVGETGVVAAAAGAEASARRADPEQPSSAVSNWDWAGKRRGGGQRWRTVPVGEAEPRAVPADTRSRHRRPGATAGLARELLQDPTMGAAQELPELAGRRPFRPTCQQWRPCAARCGPGQRQEYPPPIGLAPRSRKVRGSRFAGWRPARRFQAAEREQVAPAPTSQIVWNELAHSIWHWPSATREWLPRR